MSHSEIARAKSLPAYQVIAAQIQAKIEGGVWPVGTRLPSTAMLCREFEVSAITIRAAFKELVAVEIVESRPRSGYFVSAAAQKSPSNLIALLVESVRTPFFTECIAGVEEVCRAAGYHVLVSNSHANAELEAAHLGELAPQVAGFVVMPVSAEGNYAAYLPLLEANIPFVFLDRYLEKLAAPSVTTDNELGGFLAASHLLDCGRTQIFALGVRDSSSQRERLAGYERAFRERGLATDATWLRRTLLQNEEAGYELMRQILSERSHAEPFGVFAINDSVARGSYLAIKEAGLEIPRDAAVVGFDDVSAVFFDPPLSSVRQDMREMGRLAVQILLRALDGQRDLQSVRLAPELMVRNSTDSNSEFSPARHLRRKTGPAQRAASLAAAPTSAI